MSTLTDSNKAKTHCKHGHPFDETNTFWSYSNRDRAPFRQCLTCRKASKARYEAVTQARREALKTMLDADETNVQTDSKPLESTVGNNPDEGAKTK
jgi:hypothetical protein